MSFFSPFNFFSPLHHLGHEAGDGRGGLVWVQLGKQVADVVCCASLLPGHKPKQPGGVIKCIYKVIVGVLIFLFV